MTHSTRVEPLLQIGCATLVVLGTLLLGMGQQSFLFPMLAVVLGYSSVFIVDHKRLFRLRQFSSGMLGIGACAWLIVQIIRDTQQSQLLNVANALIFLQVILLFQRKNIRIYWQLLTLSLLQVVVAAALNLGFVFGLMLCIYIAAAIVTLAMFATHRELRAIPTDQSHFRDDERSDRFGWQPLEASGDFVLSRSFLGRLSWMATFTILGTILFFFAIPRYSSRVWQPQKEQIRTVGYDDEIELDNISKILENPEQVMRVEFTKLDRTPFYFDDEPYFRGSVVDRYRPDNGRWRADKLAESRVHLNRVGKPADLSNVVVQRITLQPGEHAVLFSMAPCYSSSDDDQDIFIKRHTRQLSLGKDRDSNGAPLRYELLTDCFQGKIQSRWIGALHPIGSQDKTNDPEQIDYEFETLIAPWGELYERQAEKLELLKQTTDEILAAAQLTDESAYAKALALEKHFLASGLYNYSLQMSTKRDHELDPIVDFVTNHRTGHCEYFASALALMLRSQGIPARLVIGYKGGDFNGVGSFFTVRQLHAHAWVEAYITEESIPPRVVSEDLRMNGAWFRLDPTPVGGTGYVDDEHPWIAKSREMIGYCQVLWDDYVLGLNSTRQQESIYKPVSRVFNDVVYFAFGKEPWQARWRWMKRTWWDIIRGRYFTRQAVILLCVLAPLVYIMRTQLRQFLSPLLKSFTARFRGSRRRQADVAIYDRMERVLRRYGFRRSNEQTPREFANATLQSLPQIPADAGIHTTLGRIVDAFYSVRFGGHTLPEDERIRLEESLTRLELVLLESRAK